VVAGRAGRLPVLRVMALFPMIAGWIFKRWQPAGYWQQACSSPALIALVDWLRSWIFTGFPWLAVGYSQAPPSPLAGFAPLLGVHGLSLLVALSGALLLRWRIGLSFHCAARVHQWLGLRQVAWTYPAASQSAWH
jgi:apolipoprotein N-acyltransferase